MDKVWLKKRKKKEIPKEAAKLGVSPQLCKKWKLVTKVGIYNKRG